MNIYEKLQKVQTELKAPKGQYNNFGKYKYRSCEDILEAVKPVLAKYKAAVTVSDKIELIGDRYYVCAAARFFDTEKEAAPIENVAYAREAADKKGMDESQITGTASSYARKYALNGLFLIDDTKDADTDEHKAQTEGKKPAEKPVDPVIEVKESKNAMIAKILKEMDRTSTGIKSIMGTYKKEYVATVGIEHNLARLTDDELADALLKFSKIKV